MCTGLKTESLRRETAEAQCLFLPRLGVGTVSFYLRRLERHRESPGNAALVKFKRDLVLKNTKAI